MLIRCHFHSSRLPLLSVFSFYNLLLRVKRAVINISIVPLNKHTNKTTHTHKLMCLSLSCGLAFLLFVFMVLTMVDFPPNLEDGEKWLPSDIYREIVYGDVDAETTVDNTRKECDSQVLDEPINTTFDVSPNGSRGVNGALFGVKMVAFQRFSRSFSPYGPIARPRCQVERFEAGGTRNLKGQDNHFWPVYASGEEGRGLISSVGTGVFIPRITNAVKESEPISETSSGVYHHSSPANAPAILPKKKMSGNGVEKSVVVKKENRGKKKGISASNDIGLP